jgi:hypothetical protein
MHQNFFDLGGNSLLLYRAYSQLRAIRSDLRVVDMFRHTTVETLAAHLAGAQHDTDDLAKSRRRGEERRAARLSAKRVTQTPAETIAH